MSRGLVRDMLESYSLDIQCRNGLYLAAAKKDLVLLILVP